MVSKKSPASTKGMVRTVFYQPPEDRDAMAKLAADLRESESELYRRAVAEYLERQAKPPKP